MGKIPTTNENDKHLNIYSKINYYFNIFKKSIKAFSKLVLRKSKINIIKLNRSSSLKQIKHTINIRKSNLKKVSLRSIFYLKQPFVRLLVAAVGTACLLCTILVCFSNFFDIGYEILANGKNMGVVKSQSVYDVALDEVNGQIVSFFGESNRISYPNIVMPKIILRDNYTAIDSLKNNIRSLSSLMVDSYVLSIDDKPTVAFLTKDALDSALDKFKQQYELKDPASVVCFTQKLSISKTKSPMTMLYTTDNALSLFNQQVLVPTVYQAKEDTTISNVAKIYGISTATIKELNSDLSNTIKAGQKIEVREYRNILEVKSTMRCTYNEAVKYETKNIDDLSLEKGKTSVITQGVNGEKQVVADIVKINGVEASRNIISEVTLKAPIAKVAKIGTQKPPSYVGTNSYIRPTFGAITSRFGSRWGRAHTGIDIGAATGTPIKAADNGIIESASYDGGYGNLIIINHKNGYTTYYGHCSTIVVKAGQKVKKGDVIGCVGSTGNSTGPHLHFEVRKNDVPQDPSNYIN